MAITYVAGVVTTLYTNAATVTAAAPPGIAAGDLLVAVVYSANVSSSTYSAPAGWVAGSGSGLVRLANAGSVGIHTKVATGSEPGSYVFGGDGYFSVAVLLYRGATGLRQAAGVASTSAVPPSPAVPGVAGDVHVLGWGNYAGSTFTTPAGTTARASGRVASYTSNYCFDRPVTSTGDTTGLTSTASAGAASGNVAWSLTLVPSGDVTPEPPAPAQATAAGSWSFTGAATAGAARTATATGAWAYTGTAAAAAARQATAAGVHGWVGNATATAPVVGEAVAAAAGIIVWTGHASGARPPEASAASTILWTGEAVAAADYTATAQGTLVWAGAAVARIPAPTRDITVTIGRATWTRALTAGPLTAGTLTARLEDE